MAISTGMPKEKTQRPLLVTIACFFGFIDGVLFILNANSPFYQAISSWHSLYMLGTGILIFIATGFIWQMRKKGFYAYGVFFLLHQVVTRSADAWVPLGLVIPTLVLGLIFPYRKNLG